MIAPRARAGGGEKTRENKSEPLFSRPLCFFCFALSPLFLPRSLSLDRNAVSKSRFIYVGGCDK